MKRDIKIDEDTGDLVITETNTVTLNENQVVEKYDQFKQQLHKIVQQLNQLEQNKQDIEQKLADLKPHYQKIIKQRFDKIQTKSREENGS